MPLVMKSPGFKPIEAQNARSSSACVPYLASMRQRRTFGPGRKRFLHNQGRDRVRGLSLINDLSAVITASDPSERRTQLFGIDCGRTRCQVVGFCNSAGATQKRRYEACIELRQGRPKSAREISRQGVVGMLVVFRGTAYLVHVTNRVPPVSYTHLRAHETDSYL